MTGRTGAQERGLDVNLNADHIGILHTYMGGVRQFTGAAWFASEVAESELTRVTDLMMQCERARAAAVASLTVRRVQAEARKAAGRIVNDTESYALDIAVADALVAGLAEPAIKVISGSCLVHAPLSGCAMAEGTAADSWSAAQEILNAWPAEPADLSVTGTSRRLRDALAALPTGRVGWLDIAALIRQVLLEHQARHGTTARMMVPARRHFRQAGNGSAQAVRPFRPELGSFPCWPSRGNRRPGPGSPPRRWLPTSIAST